MLASLVRVYLEIPDGGNLASKQFILRVHISAVARIRNALAYATHTFFQMHNLYVHTPIITTSDCEGAGEMFQVTTLFSDADKVDKELKQKPPPSEADIEAAKKLVSRRKERLIKSAKAKKEDITDLVSELKKAKDDLTHREERFKLKPGLPEKDGKIDYTRDFFAWQAFLTVSGQLQVETFSCALSNVYTFGPTFRAEHSHTSRHLAEFWMVEPEIAFADLEGFLQPDMWGVVPSDRWDWSALKSLISKNGGRNSLLVAPMSTASTSQILGNNECFEPYTSNIYSRRVLR
ncbi:hypothetical protein IFM89_029748 [Coptis chinensis]|uniref:Ribonucleotide reductase large subunit C-terminal domain-containing protein n=1 Tax=Coptis chinensis TaxID=261450 RepID=A0A835I475_9MAGN|nr:hypothetical protein IFM89_029748 [Coptis chinensis]